MVGGAQRIAYVDPVHPVSGGVALWGLWLSVDVNPAHGPTGSLQVGSNGNVAVTFPVHPGQRYMADCMADLTHSQNDGEVLYVVSANGSPDQRGSISPGGGHVLVHVENFTDSADRVVTLTPRPGDVLVLHSCTINTF